MTLYRFILILLTWLVALLIGTSLLGSWTKPQPQSQLNLYQSDLLLQASEWRDLEVTGAPRFSPLLGADPVKDALKNYEEVRQSAQEDYDQLNRQGVTKSGVPEPQRESVELGAAPVPRSPQEMRGQLLDELDLRLGILYARHGQPEEAVQRWTRLTTAPKAQGSLKERVKTAQVLLGLWSQPPRLLPNAQAQLQDHLTGWFRYQALFQLYTLQQRQEAIVELQIQEQSMAQRSLTRLLIVGGLPILGSSIGVGILVFWGVRAYLNQRQDPSDVGSEALRTESGKGKVTLATQQLEPSSPEQSQCPELEQPDQTVMLASQTSPVSARNLDVPLGETVPWNGEVIGWVMVLWFLAFFGVSGVVIPLLVQLLHLRPETFDARTQAYFALLSYSALMASGFSIIYLVLKRFVSRPLQWFPLDWQRPWLGWGISGYFAALPLIVVISLINQQLLHDQGGGNPLLEIILQSRDRLTIGILFFMVAVLAPIFEETVFRGFFLTSLTRYLPPWGAIACSAFVFAIAHLNISDLLPLTVLGMVLGFVYTRSRNLLSSMLLHGLWNSGSFLGLLILGSNTG